MKLLMNTTDPSTLNASRSRNRINPPSHHRCPLHFCTNDQSRDPTLPCRWLPIHPPQSVCTSSVIPHLHRQILPPMSSMTLSDDIFACHREEVTFIDIQILSFRTLHIHQFCHEFAHIFITLSGLGHAHEFHELLDI